MINLNSYLKILPNIVSRHSRKDILHKKLSEALKVEVEGIFGEDKECSYTFDDIGRIEFPYRTLGNVDSSGMFALDELIVFSYYIINRTKYKNVLDVGANLGIHSIVLSKLGANVLCFEPDKDIVNKLEQNLEINNINNVEIISKAISNRKGIADFCRVCDNQAGSHLKGQKSDPYGHLEYFEVEVDEIDKYLNNIDYVKIDAEGSEANILCSILPERLKNIDLFVEVGSEENAKRIFEHYQNTTINLFSQKLCWGKVTKHDQIPFHHTQGLLFMSADERMNWNN